MGNNYPPVSQQQFNLMGHPMGGLVRKGNEMDIQRLVNGFGFTTAQAVTWTETQTTFDASDIPALVAMFPESFRLRGFPKLRFKLNIRDSFVSNGTAMLAIDVLEGYDAKSFSNGTYAEIARELVL